MSSSPNWCTIESDPGVFTSLIESFGVKNAELSELWSLDDDSLGSLVEEYGKVYGLIFLFKWQSDHSSNTTNNNDGSSKEDTNGRTALVGDDVPENLFFAKQVTHNACATQAILSVLLNAVAPNKGNDDEEEEEDDTTNNKSCLVLGKTLTSLKTFTASFPPDLRGEAISASDDIRTAHNSFARKETFLTEEKTQRAATDDDDIFHFVAYVPHEDGNVYELDGLQAGPIPAGKYSDNNDTSSSSNSHSNDLAWLSVARTAIQSRIEKYASSEIKFNLMAVVRDKRVEIQSKMDALAAAGIVDDDDDVLSHMKAELAKEERKRQQWNVENERRRHNYLPFCIELIKGLAASGKLPALTKQANDRHDVLRKKAFMKKTIGR